MNASEKLNIWQDACEAAAPQIILEVVKMKKICYFSGKQFSKTDAHRETEVALICNAIRNGPGTAALSWMHSDHRFYRDYAPLVEDYKNRPKQAPIIVCLALVPNGPIELPTTEVMYFSQIFTTNPLLKTTEDLERAMAVIRNKFIKNTIETHRHFPNRQNFAAEDKTIGDDLINWTVRRLAERNQRRTATKH